MQDFPHFYQAAATSDSDGDVTVTSPGLRPLDTASPTQFGGPGDRWSPETLFTAAVADCYILTFRAVAVASHLAWSAIHCEATGTLDRVERVTRFTSVALRASVRVPAGTDEGLAQRVLEKAERACLISNSLGFPVVLDTHVIVEAPLEAAAAR